MPSFITFDINFKIDFSPIPEVADECMAVTTNSPSIYEPIYIQIHT